MTINWRRVGLAVAEEVVVGVDAFIAGFFWINLNDGKVFFIRLGPVQDHALGVHHFTLADVSKRRFFSANSFWTSGLR